MRHVPVALALAFAGVTFLAGAVMARYDMFPPQVLISLKRRFVPPVATLAGNANRQAMFAAFPYGHIIMLGDSLTERGLWSDMFPEIRISNRGISGDTTINLLARLSRPEYQKPGVIFLMIGINDISIRLPVDGIVSRYAAILRCLHKIGSTVYAQSILPTARPWKNKISTVINERIAAECDKIVGCHFLDLRAPIAALGPRAFVDDVGTHLTARGYVAWRDALRPVIHHLEGQSIAN